MQDDLGQSQSNETESFDSKSPQPEVSKVEEKSQENFRKQTNLEKMRAEDEAKVKKEKEKSNKLKEMRTILENLKIKLGVTKRMDITAQELQKLPELQKIAKELSHDGFIQLTKYLDDNLENPDKKSVLIGELMEMMKKNIK